MYNYFIVQNSKTNEFVESIDNNQIKLTNDVTKAYRFDLAEGSQFLEEHTEEYILKSENRVLRELTKNVI